MLLRAHREMRRWRWSQIVTTSKSRASGLFPANSGIRYLPRSGVILPPLNPHVGYRTEHTFQKANNERDGETVLPLGRVGFRPATSAFPEAPIPEEIEHFLH